MTAGIIVSPKKVIKIFGHHFHCLFVCFSSSTLWTPWNEWLLLHPCLGNKGLRNPEHLPSDLCTHQACGLTSPACPGPDPGVSSWLDMLETVVGVSLHADVRLLVLWQWSLILSLRLRSTMQWENLFYSFPVFEMLCSPPTTCDHQPGSKEKLIESFSFSFASCPHRCPQLANFSKLSNNTATQSSSAMDHWSEISGGFVAIIICGNRTATSNDLKIRRKEGKKENLYWCGEDLLGRSSVFEIVMTEREKKQVGRFNLK